MAGTQIHTVEREIYEHTFFSSYEVRPHNLCGKLEDIAAIAKILLCVCVWNSIGIPLLPLLCLLLSCFGYCHSWSLKVGCKVIRPLSSNVKTSTRHVFWLFEPCLIRRCCPHDSPALCVSTFLPTPPTQRYLHPYNQARYRRCKVLFFVIHDATAHFSSVFTEFTALYEPRRHTLFRLSPLSYAASDLLRSVTRQATNRFSGSIVLFHVQGE